MCGTSRPALSAMEAAVDSTRTLSKVLVEDCVWNVRKSTAPGDDTEAKAHESLHPYFPKCSYGDEIVFDGAKALRVKFHPRCETESTAALYFYADKAQNRQISAFSGAAGSFKEFVVHSDRFFFRFKSDAESSNNKWGYKFNVSPMRGLQWLNEQQVRYDASLEWACWLLNFLLEEVGDLVATGAVHNGQMMTAFLGYLRTPGVPYKSRIIALCTQLLKAPHNFPASDRPDWSVFSGIQSIVFAEAQRRRSAGALFWPQRLQQMMELCATALQAKRVIDNSEAPRVAFKPRRDMQSVKMVCGCCFVMFSQMGARDSADHVFVCFLYFCTCVCSVGEPRHVPRRYSAPGAAC